MVNLLIEKGAMEFNSFQSPTALDIAASVGHERIVCILLKPELNCPSSMDKKFNSALDSAVLADQDSVVFSLLELSKTLARNPASSTSFRISREELASQQHRLEQASKHNCEKVVQLLLDRGFGKEKNALVRPLEAASRDGHMRIAKLLLAVRSKRHLRSDELPLMLAVRRGDRDMVGLLLDHGADANASYELPLAKPLVTAASAGEVEMMRYLIKKGADIHLNNCGQAALAVAGSRKFGDAVRFLLNAGVDPSAILKYHEHPGEEGDPMIKASYLLFTLYGAYPPNRRSHGHSAWLHATIMDWIENTRSGSPTADAQS
jgi:ankyrin repeat protein